MSKKKKNKRKKKSNIGFGRERSPFAESFFEQNIYRLKKLGIAVAILAALLGIGFLVSDHFTVKTVVVEGNVHYTDDAIQEMVMGGKLGHNSLYLSMKYHDKQIEDVPFVEAMDVAIVSADSVKITVYEKTMAGFVE